MKEKYEIPELEVVVFEGQDIIVSSPIDDGGQD